MSSDDDTTAGAGATPPPPPGGYPPNWGSAYPQQPGQPLHQPYGQPVWQQPKHQQSTTALVLGIIGITACGVVAPFAWSIGSKAVREIDASGGQLGGRSEANAGRIMGIVGTVLLALSLLFLVGFIILAVVVDSGSSQYDDDYYDYFVRGALGLGAVLHR